MLFWRNKCFIIHHQFSPLAKPHGRFSTLSVKREHGLDGDINPWELIGLKHHLQGEKRVKNHTNSNLIEVYQEVYYNKQPLKPRWSSLGSWWGSWAAPWAGSCSFASRCWASRGQRCSPTGASYRPSSSRSRSPSGNSPPAWSAAHLLHRQPLGPTGHRGEVKGQ